MLLCIYNIIYIYMINIKHIIINYYIYNLYINYSFLFLHFTAGEPWRKTYMFFVLNSYKSAGSAARTEDQYFL